MEEKGTCFLSPPWDATGAVPFEEVSRRYMTVARRKEVRGRESHWEGFWGECKEGRTAPTSAHSYFFPFFSSPRRRHHLHLGLSVASLRLRLRGLEWAMKRMSDNMKKHKANHRPIWRARHFWTEKGISIPTMSRDGNARLNLGAPAGLGLVSGLQCGNCFD